MQHLFEICKSETDKEVEAQAIDSLRATRFVLIDIISGYEKLTYIKFLDMIKGITIADEHIRALRNSIASVVTLEKIFQDIHKNVSAKVTHQLENIMKVTWSGY